MSVVSFRIAILVAVACVIVACRNQSTFNSDRVSLYSQSELWKGFSATSRTQGFDGLVYEEYIATGKFYPDRAMSILRSRHDEGIASALRAFVHDRQRNAVGIMGSGNSMLRCSLAYEKTVHLAWTLAHDGKYLIVTGGGPGQMEAANLGAYLADREATSIDQALRILRTNIVHDPTSGMLKAGESFECNYNRVDGKDDEFAYTVAALAVLKAFPNGHENLGIPTWFYGNEPPNVFATRVAKFFSNGVREDLLVTIPMAGLVISPGGAGTRQEIFMDMTQNYYNNFCYRSPVVFFGVQYYGPIPAEKEGDTETESANPGIYSLVHKLTDKNFRSMLVATDDPTDALTFLQKNPPKSDEKPKQECSNMPG